jgi:S1-C subfamily serine protease
MLGAAGAAGAQVAIATPRGTIARTLMPSTFDYETPRAVIGVTTSISTGSRDTLGLLVSSVTRGSPAEKAGIEEGNRITSINGVNLKLAPADVDDPDMQRVMSRRLVRELDKVKPGDDIDLRIWANGQAKAVKLKTVDPDSLYSSPARSVFKDLEDRGTLGLGYASSGSKRDTLGVFVMSVEEDGPAARAGVEEGARIQAINGVDLRVNPADAGDELVSMTRINRFEREMNKVKPGDAVELRVYQDGQVKTVKATAVSFTELHKGRTRVIRNGSGFAIMGTPDVIKMDMEAVRRATETAVRAAAGAAVGTPNGTIRWFDDEINKPISTTLTIPKRTVIKM